MAESEWKIAKRGANCSGCSNALPAEEPYFSVLLEQPEGLLRQDFCPVCFDNKRPSRVYYFWKAAPATGENGGAHKRQPVVDIEYVLEFFKRLEGDADPQKIAFRYILALMLARKKILIFEQRKKDAAGCDVHVFREKRGGAAHQVSEPALSEQEITAVSAELGVLLGIAPPPAPPVPPAAEDPAAPSAQPQQTSNAVERTQENG